jgi:hypothetical protein
LSDISGRPGVEKSQKLEGDQATDIVEGLAMAGSLWDLAYDALKSEDPDHINAYEVLLSKVLLRGKPSFQARQLPSVLA